MTDWFKVLDIASWQLVAITAAVILILTLILFFRRRKVKEKMMKTVGIYNFDIGLNPSEEALSPFRVGPFEIRFVKDYKSAAKRLPRQAKKTTQFDPDGNDKPVFTPASPGGWTVTAHASFSEDSPESSVLAHKELKDNGLWDLCEILTFLTGRRVSCDEYLESTHITHLEYLGCPVLEAKEFVGYAERAWHNRRSFESRGIGYSLYAYNEAISQKNMHLLGYLHFLSLEVVQRSYNSGNSLAIAKNKRKIIKDAVLEVLAKSAKELELTDEQVNALTGAVGSTIDQGPGNAVSRLTDLLTHLKVVPEKPSSETITRVQSVNRVRNFFVHTGSVPTFKNASDLMSLNVTGAVIVGIVPEICRLAIAEALGYRIEDHRKLRQYRGMLSTFFDKGTWREWDLNTDFNSWYYGEDESKLTPPTDAGSDEVSIAT